MLVLLLLCLATPALAQSDAAHQQFMFAYKLLQRHEDKLAGDAFDQYLGRFPKAPMRGDALYYRALLWHRLGSDKQAAKALEHVPAPKLVPAYAVELLRGQVLYDLHQYKAALAALEAIDAGKLKGDLGVSVNYLKGLTYRGASNLPAAAAALAAAAKVKGDMQPRTLLDLARVQALLHKPADALASLTQSLKLGDPKVSPAAAHLAGDLAYRQKQHDKAAAYYRVVLERYQTSPDFQPAAIGLLWSQYAGKHYADTLATYAHYHKALDKTRQGEAAYLAGSAAQALGKYKQAIPLLEHAAGTHPRSGWAFGAKALYKIALCQFHLGQDGAMRQTLASLEKRFPKSSLHADAIYLLAAADAKAGKASQGAARLSKLILQGPKSAYYRPALLRRAQLYETNGKPAAAARDYQRYLESEPRRVAAGSLGSSSSKQTQQAALHLIDLQYKLGQFKQAAAAAQQLLKSAKDEPTVQQEALYRLALTQLRLGQSKAALATLDALQKRYPLNAYAAVADYDRALLLLQTGQAKKAAPLLAKSGANHKLSLGQRAGALHLLAVQQRQSGQDDQAAATLHQLAKLVGMEHLSDSDRLWLAERAMAAGDAKAALAVAEPLTHNKPGRTPETRAEALYRTGRAELALGQADHAERRFRHVLAMSRGFELRAQLALAQSLAKQGKLEAAIREDASLISAERSDIAAQALYDSAVMQRELARHADQKHDAKSAARARTEATRLLQRLVLLYNFQAVEPLPQLAYVNLAEVAAAEGDDAAAQKAWRELIAHFPDDAFGTYARAAMAAQARHLGKAVALLTPLTKRNLDDRLAQRVATMLKKTARPRQ